MLIPILMEKNNNTVIAVIAVLILVGIAGAYTYLGSDSVDTDVSSLEAVTIVESSPMAINYSEEYFHVEEWRVTSTDLIDSVPNGTVEENSVWRVRIMERSCACSGVKDLYVIEGFVSSSTGELLSIETKSVLESKYDKKTCSSTSCH
ncbi:MAG: hypothetical protein PWQ51_1204 [Methanolobus sp.]|jgi:hypothetical protein|uniref:Uncharacterized protein n=2 Tax=Methanosarcinaceae TaxID=2206 RepID=W9DQE8_METTI|nr:hypothetical protein MettiDRAFT_1107 [Methanolobus tindarius DSM 2278]MDK2832757.1 hypothetical protein [Methanolobus sp.]MDK2939040.1 hypothetical protein [Methanolobus sp.]